AYANAASLRIDRVLAIHDGGQGGYMPQMGAMDARMVAPPPVVAVQAEQAAPVMAGTNAGMVTRFPYLHDSLASTSMQGEDSLWADLDARLAHWQGQSWREDKVMVAALAGEARRFNRRHPVGDRHRRAACGMIRTAMAESDIEAIRREVRASDFVRGTPADVEVWHEADAESRANIAIEGMALTPAEEASFNMLREEAVPPPLATQIILKSLDHPDADPASGITPSGQESNAGCILAVAGGLAVVYGTSWSLEKSSPVPVASTIAWVASAAYVVFVWKYAMQERSNGSLGSARFGDRADVRKSETNGDLSIGRSAKSGKSLHYDGAAHSSTMAPTRSGKGVGTIIPNSLSLDRSVVCIDPKGENARVTARTRVRKGPVWCSDPFGVSGCPAARYNPLAQLDPASPDIAEDAQTIADASVHDAPGQSGEAHWNEEAKASIAGVISHTVIHEPPARATSATVRDKLTRDPSGFAALSVDMQASTGAHGSIAR
ncbi:hypothetical protein OY671_007513, partial [Metschnikowia pulcherrima]